MSDLAMLDICDEPTIGYDINRVMCGCKSAVVDRRTNQNARNKQWYTRPRSSRSFGTSGILYPAVSCSVKHGGLDIGKRRYPRRKVDRKTLSVLCHRPRILQPSKEGESMARNCRCHFDSGYVKRNAIVSIDVLCYNSKSNTSTTSVPVTVLDST